MTRVTAAAAAIAIAIGAGTAAPRTAIAATVEQTHSVTKTYQTTFQLDSGRSVAFAGGILRLTSSKEGYINGDYNPPGTGILLPVVGGRNGADVWFDIGTATKTTHVTGTLEGERIVGYAVEPDGSQYRFNATPPVGGG